MSVETDNPEDGMTLNTESLLSTVKNYYRWNLSVFPMRKGSRILDLGCGSGLYLDAIVRYSPGFYLATDISPRFVERLRKRMTARKNCQAERVDFLADEISPVLMNQSFDYVLCFDVIEHIVDDVMALRRIRDIVLRTGRGVLFLRVPALPVIYGRNDEIIGHFRRYTVTALQEALTSAGFEISTIRYQNIAGVLPWFVIGKLMKRSLAVAPNEGRVFDAAVPLLRRFEKCFPPPIGLSIYCVATVA